VRQKVSYLDRNLKGLRDLFDKILVGERVMA